MGKFLKLTKFKIIFSFILFLFLLFIPVVPCKTGSTSGLFYNKTEMEREHAINGQWDTCGVVYDALGSGNFADYFGMTGDGNFFLAFGYIGIISYLISAIIIYFFENNESRSRFKIIFMIVLVALFYFIPSPFNFLLYFFPLDLFAGLGFSRYYFGNLSFLGDLLIFAYVTLVSYILASIVSYLLKYAQKLN